MNVLVLTSLFPNNQWPHHGVFIKERMARFAALDGCAVAVVAPVPYFPPLKINYRWRFSQIARCETIEGLDVYHPRYIMTPKVGMSLYGLLMFLSVLQTVRMIQRDFSFDLIDGHYVYPDGFAAVLLGRVLHKPVVVSARGSDINQYMQFPVIRQFLRYTVRHADGMIAVCQALKDAMIPLGIDQEKVVVVPNGVDTAKFYPVDQAAARQRLGLPADRRVMLSVGGLIPRKGFDLFIKAFKKIRDEGAAQDVAVVIVGEGESRKQLTHLIHALELEAHVRLAGDIPHHDLRWWYSAADLFCLASSREGWPNVVLESLACGTPVVATNVWGTPEVLRSEDVGLLTERTANALAQTLVRGLTKHWDREGIVRYAREQSWQRVAQSIHEVFSSVLQRLGKAALDPHPRSVGA